MTNFLIKNISKGILNVMGWKQIGKLNHKKSVVISYPHTSYMDSFIALLFSVNNYGFSVIQGEKLIWRLFSKLTNNISVNRNKSSNQVQQIIDEMNKRDKCNVMLFPDGTIQKQKYIRSGFYWIAKQSNVPLYLATFDFNKKTLKVSNPIDISNLSLDEVINITKIHFIEKEYSHLTAKFPDRAGEYKLNKI